MPTLFHQLQAQGLEGRHRDQRAVRPRLARRDVRPQRPPRRLPGPRPRHARPARRSPRSRRQGSAAPRPRRGHRHRLRPGSHREDPRGGRARTAVKGNLYITDADKAAIDVKNGGKYVVAADHAGRRRRRGSSRAAAERRPRRASASSASSARRPSTTSPTAPPTAATTPLPTSTARPRPTPPPTCAENPTLADMTRAALTVLGARPEPALRPLRRGGRRRFRPPREQPRQRHRRRLQRRGRDQGDHRLGREANSNWDESVMIVTADHGHYLVLDDPAALLAPKGEGGMTMKPVNGRERSRPNRRSASPPLRPRWTASASGSCRTSSPSTGASPTSRENSSST